MKYPGTNNWGDWRDVKPGESPDEYYARTGLAGYGATPEQLAKEQEERNKIFGNTSTKMATGPLNIEFLTDADCAYLVGMGEYMTFDPRNLASGEFFGKVSQRLGHDGYTDMQSVRFDPIGFEQSGKVNPTVIALVKSLAEGDPKTFDLYPVFGGESREGRIFHYKTTWNLVHSGIQGWVGGRPVNRQPYNLIP